MNAIRPDAQGIILTLRVVPRATRDEVGGVIGDAIKVRLRAPPVEGKANAALVAFLARALDVRPRDVVLLAGDQSRLKRVLIRGLAAATVETRLLGGRGADDPLRPR